MLNYSYTIFFALLSVFYANSLLLAVDPVLSPSETDLIRDRQERLLQDQQKRLDELQQLPNTSSAAKLHKTNYSNLL